MQRDGGRRRRVLLPLHLVDRHDERDDAVDPLRARRFRRFDIPGRIRLERDIPDAPAQHRVSVVPQPLRRESPSRAPSTAPRDSRTPAALRPPSARPVPPSCVISPRAFQGSTPRHLRSNARAQALTMLPDVLVIDRIPRRRDAGARAAPIRRTAPDPAAPARRYSRPARKIPAARRSPSASGNTPTSAVRSFVLERSSPA